MNLLVTGGAGFIGSHFCNLIAPQIKKLVILDKLTYAADLSYLDCSYLFVVGDICDQALVRKTLHKHDIDTIVHFAAESHVDRSIQSAAAFVKTNIVGTQVLIDEFKDHNPDGCVHKRFIHVSTDEVYGVAEEGTSFTESTPYAPNSPYAASKAASDLMVRSYYKTHNFPAVITHCSNNFGPHQADEKLIPTVIRSLVNNKPIPVYGSGKQIRDWISVHDHCTALMTVLYKGRLGETYNIGGGNELTNIDLVHLLCDEYSNFTNTIGSRELIEHVTDRLGHDARYSVDIAKIRNELEWIPTRSFNSEINCTLEYYFKKYSSCSTAP